MAEPAREYETTQTDDESPGWEETARTAVRAACSDLGYDGPAGRLEDLVIYHLRIPLARRMLDQEHYAQQRWEDGYQAALADRGRLRVIRGR